LPFLLVESTPDAMIGADIDRPFQAREPYWAAAADLSCLLLLGQGRSGGADRE
jgi:hypothetical protein